MENAWKSEFKILMSEVEKGLSKYQKCERQKHKEFYFNPKALGYDNTKEKVKIESENDAEMFNSDCISHIELSKDQELDVTSSTTENNLSRKKYGLLINNLEGCKPDMDKLKSLFDSLGYIVIGPILDVTYIKLKEVIKEFKERDHDNSAFIIFYGDGFGDYIVTSDHYAVHLNEL